MRSCAPIGAEGGRGRTKRQTSSATRPPPYYSHKTVLPPASVFRSRCLVRVSLCAARALFSLVLFTNITGCFAFKNSIFWASWDHNNDGLPFSYWMKGFLSCSSSNVDFTSRDPRGESHAVGIKKSRGRFAEPAVD